MESGYYSATAGLIARNDALEVAANNLANINTTGYKAQREYFSSMVADAAANLNPLNHAVNDFGVLGGAHIDLAPGNLERTSNELDLAVEGNGFFELQTKGGKRYTRDGNFRLTANRQLQTQNGDPVLSDQGQPIQLPSGKLSISPDGTISVDNNIVARLRLMDLRDAQLATEGANKLLVESGPIKPATDASIRQGMLESGNLSVVAASVGLITVQRQADLLQRAVTIFHTEFNRSAAEDLPKV